jgi:hypothetical protein
MMSNEWRKSSYSGSSGNCVEVRWQKSSHSGMNGNCVEVSWQKSSYSGPTGNCIEARASAPGHVAIRDSKDKAGPRLTVNDRAWDAFIRGIKRGEFGI